MHDSRDRGAASDGGDDPPTDRYRRYADWKGWSDSGPAAAADRQVFAAELAGIPLRDRDVLEIGFGRGDFLAWAREQGARVFGIERDSVLVGRARAAGFEAEAGDLATVAVPGERRFDLIVAIDVLEHVPLDTLLRWFDRLPMLLRPGGRMVARFPNGQSPIGRIFQHGDITHVTTLSPAIAQQLAAIAGLDLVRVANSHRPRAGRGLRRVGQWARDRVRGGVEIALARLYGITRTPLDPNVTAVWQLPAHPSRIADPPLTSARNGRGDDP